MRPLPDLTKLTTATPALRELAKRLSGIGLTLERAAPVVRAAAAVAPPLRRPVQLHHLRKATDDAALAMRMFMFDDPVDEPLARKALGGVADTLVTIGLLVPDERGRLVCPMCLGLVDDLYVLSDDLSRGGEAVMGLGETTVKLCRAAMPPTRVRSALDLGCGSGTAALALARVADRVVATDVSERAVSLARINAVMNGIDNVDVRQGDLFAPVAGERFDRVVSQPPFVPLPDGGGGSTFLHGGRRGDELALRLIGGLSEQLASDGLAVLYVEWPDVGGDAPLEERLRAATGTTGLDLLVLRAPPTGVDEHAVAYAAGSFPRLDEAFLDEAMRRRAHYDAVGIRSLTSTFVIARQRPRGWTHVVPVGPMAGLDVESRRIDALLEARDLVGDHQRLLGSALRVPEGTVLSQEQVDPGADRPSTLHARFSATALIEPMALGEELLLLLTCVHEAPTVADGIERFAEAHEVDPAVARERLLPAIDRALAAGLLEVAR